MIRNLPLKYKDNNARSSNILAKPILDRISFLGTNLNGMQIQYLNEQDDINVIVGIYGHSIDDQTTIDQDDLKINGTKINLKLFATQQEGNQKMPNKIAESNH